MVKAARFLSNWLDATIFLLWGEGSNQESFQVIALDNFYTGRKRNVERWIGHPHFELVHHDVVNPYMIEGFPYLFDKKA